MNQDVGFITASHSSQGTQGAKTEAVLHGMKTRKASSKVSGQAAYIWYLNLKTCIIEKPELHREVEKGK